MGGIVAHRARSAGTRHEFHAERKPSRLARREIGRSRRLLRGGPGGQRHTGEAGQDAAAKQSCSRSECAHGSFSSRAVPFPLRILLLTFAPECPSKACYRACCSCKIVLATHFTAVLLVRHARSGSPA